MKKQLISLSFLVALLACGPADKTTADTSGAASLEKAEKAVFAVHDEAMPRIDEVMKLKKALNGKLTALDTIPALTPAQILRADEQKAQMRQLVTRLTQADSLMMDWMANYNGDTLKKLPEAEALRYLTDQQQRITHAKNKINQSIDQAKTYLRQ